MSQKKEACRCPIRPAYPPGSLASGSAHETVLLEQWEAEHGSHPYARARDELAKAMQAAEAQVGGGVTALDLVHEVLGLPEGAKSAAERTREIDWMGVRPDEMPNLLINVFRVDPNYGSHHPLVRVGLFRLREALARVSNSLGGYFGS